MNKSLITTFIIFLSMAGVISAQARKALSVEVLATAAGKTFTVDSLTPEVQKLYAERSASLAEYRRQLLEQMTRKALLENEAKARASTPESLLEKATANLVTPTADEIQKVYDANAERLARPLADVRDQIVDYLTRAAAEKAVDQYFATLRARYKPALGRDINVADLRPGDVVLRLGTQTITVADFDSANRTKINDREMQIYEAVRSDLSASIFSVLVAEEAAARKTDATSIIAAEITDNLKSFTDEERIDLESKLQKRLFDKYNAKILLRESPRLRLDISADDDPSIGPASAPVTLVEFVDFQCSACAATHPILKRVLAEYAGKVRWVVRDFPLVSTHENAFRAALAANAAGAQGKYFEYIGELYANQENLDDASLKRFAATLGLNPKQFELDLNDAKNAAEVRKDMDDGARYGAAWTPTIFVNGVKLFRTTLDGIREAIDRALAERR